jgi:TrmH RNA methyltransferase
VDALADLRVQIPGTGRVESLNVSVACGVVLGECWRRSRSG